VQDKTVLQYKANLTEKLIF